MPFFYAALLHFFRKSIVGLLSLALALSILFSACPSFASAKLIFIFDASGSMWGQIDGVAKITIAKEALEELAGAIPEDTNVGLVAYGHRKKGDCADIEELIPPAPLDKSKLSAAVKAINPKGKTPMADSVRLVADKLKTSEEEASIILISDGKETCNADPCKLVGELKQAGINFTLHVVGFDVGGETEAQLQCMAEAGGGVYLPAKDADKLKSALGEVIKKSVDKNLKISVFLNGKPIGASVEVTDPKTGERVAHAMLSAPEPILMGLNPDVYTVTVADEWQQEGRPTLVFENVQITESEVREIEANFGSGTLIIWTYKNGEPFKASTRLSTMDDETVGGGYETTYPDKPAQYILQPGTYRLMAEDSWGAGTQKDLGVVEITAGQTVEKKVSFDTGTLVVWTHRDGKPFHASVIVKDKDGKTMGGGWGTTYEDRPETYVLEPGVYSLDAQASWDDPVVMLKFGFVEIKPGETLTKICDFSSPPPQDQTPPTSDASTQSSPVPPGEATPQTSAADSPKQTADETAADVPQSPETADTATPPLPEGGDAQAETNPAGAPPLPAGVGAQPMDNPVGAPPPDVDYSNVGAVDTGGGLMEDERPEQAPNPYEGMTPEEAQAQFGKEVGLQAAPVPGQDIATEKWRLGKTYPLQAKRYSDTLGRRLDTYEEQATAQGRSDVLERIRSARADIEAFNKLLKQRPGRDVMQENLDRLVQVDREIKAEVGPLR